MGVISKKPASRFRKAERQLGDLRRQAAADFAQVPRDVKTVEALVRSTPEGQQPTAPDVSRLAQRAAIPEGPTEPVRPVGSGVTYQVGWTNGREKGP
jgi:hypothetical protein